MKFNRRSIAAKLTWERRKARRLWQREFLSLAATWLQCRWCLMGGCLLDADGVMVHPGARTMADVGYLLLGETDHAEEMKAMIQERKHAL